MKKLLIMTIGLGALIVGINISATNNSNLGSATAVATPNATQTSVNQSTNNQVLPTANPQQSAQQTAAPANGVMTAQRPFYTLQLNSNPTTGYSWFIVSYPHNLVKIVKH